MIYECKYCESPFDLKDRIPRIIKMCGHTICQKCLYTVITKGQILVCIEDGNEISNLNNQIQSFPRNISLIQILQNQKEVKSDQTYSQVEKLSDVLSDGQSSIYEKSQKISKIEDQSVQTNKKTLSKKNQEYSKSQFDSVQENLSIKNCKEHFMPLEIVCRDCGEKCCYQCGLFGKHKNHSHIRIEDFKEQLDEEKTEINQKLKELEQKESFLKNNLIKEYYHPLQKQKLLKIKSNINQSYEKAVQKLQNQKQQLIKDVETTFLKNEEHLQKQVNFDYTNIAKNNVTFKRKLKLCFLKMEKFEENEQEILNLKKSKKLDVAKNKIEKSVNLFDKKINHFKEIIQNYFKSLDQKSKVQLITKFSQFQLPQLENLLLEKKIECIENIEENQFDIEMDGEIDLLTYEVPDLTNQTQFLDQVYENQVQEKIQNNNMRKVNSEQEFQQKILKIKQKKLNSSFANPKLRLKSPPQRKIEQYGRSSTRISNDFNAMKNSRHFDNPKIKTKVHLNQTLQQPQIKEFQKMNRSNAFFQTQQTNQIFSNKEKLQQTINEYKNNQTDYLDLENLNLDDTTVSLLIQVLRFSQNLKKVNLSFNQFSNQGMKHILEDISANKNIEEIDLSHNNLNSLTLKEILNHLRSGKKFTKIRISGTNIKQNNKMKAIETFKNYGTNITFEQFIKN